MIDKGSVLNADMQFPKHNLLKKLSTLQYVFGKIAENYLIIDVWLYC